MKTAAFTSSDLENLPNLQPADWPDILPHYLFYTGSGFCYPIKISEKNEMLGIGAAIVMGNIAWLGHIIVHPQHRNRGIGSAITSALIELCKTKFCETIYLIATDLGAPVYEKAGFETETEYAFYRDLKINETGISKNIRAYSGEWNEDILKLDFSATGERRALLLDNHLDTASLYINGNTLEGAYFPNLGEGFVVANNALAGTELMKLRMQTKENASFPLHNAAAQQFMLDHDYAPFRRAKRMRLGTKRTWNAQMIYNRVGGNLG